MSEDTVVATIKLKKPLIDINKNVVEELQFKELVLEDFIEFKQTDFLEVKKVIEITSRITGVDRKAFNKMSPKDYLACSMMVQSFFEDSPEIPLK